MRARSSGPKAKVPSAAMLDRTLTKDVAGVASKPAVKLAMAALAVMKPDTLGSDVTPSAALAPVSRTSRAVTTGGAPPTRRMVAVAVVSLPAPSVATAVNALSPSARGTPVNWNAPSAPATALPMTVVPDSTRTALPGSVTPVRPTVANVVTPSPAGGVSDAGSSPNAG